MSTYRFKVNGFGSQEISSIHIVHDTICTKNLNMDEHVREIIIRSDDNGKTCTVNGETIAQNATYVTVWDNKGCVIFYNNDVVLSRIISE